MLLLAAPVIAFWLMHFSPINQHGSIDAYFYTGYIHNFVDLFDRYGTTYYVVRFGMIMPAQIATALFGPIGGFFALRYVLVLIAGIPFYALVKQRYGLAVAVSLTLYTAAVNAELLRAGILSLDRGQTEAARSLGLSYWQTMRLVILPQAFRRILAPLIAQFTILLKDSSLGAIIITTLTAIT